MKAISEWCKENGVYLPEPYMILLSHANGFLVDFDSTKVGYFKFYSFDNERSPENQFNRTKEKLLARKYESIFITILVIFSNFNNFDLIQLSNIPL